MAAENPVDLQELVRQWGREFDLERELAGLTAGPDATWVPLAVADRRAGVSRSTLRAWYRTGQVASRLTPGPHGLQRLVPLEVVLDRVARSPRTGAKQPVPAAGAAPEEVAPMSTPEAMVRLAELAASAAEARAKAAEARAEAAEAALREALERAAAAEAELRLRRP